MVYVTQADVIIWTVAAAVFFMLIVFHLVASIKISEMGGSGPLYFFFFIFYILCSNAAEKWPKFHKWIALYLSFTLLGLTVYILAYREDGADKK